MRLRLRLAVLLALAALPTAVTNAQTSRGPGARMGADDARIDSVFQFIAPDAPGCAVGIYKSGALTWARGYGLSSVEHAVPIGPRTIFDIGSTSKQFTATLIHLLVAEQRITLADPVRRHVPELPAWGDSITVLQLLNHTAGVRDYLTLMGLGGIDFENLTTQAQAVRAIARQRALDFAPGTDFSYSNSGYLLLAEIVARVSKKSFATVVQERLFAPLGMSRSVLLDNHTRVVLDKAGSYMTSPSGFILEVSNFEQVGDGAVQTSLEELAKWVANFENPTVGDASLIRDMQTPARLVAGRTLGYARGLMVDSVRGAQRIRHGGAWVGFRADLVRFPRQRLATAALCNRGDVDPSALLDRVSMHLLDDAGVPKEAVPKAGVATSVATTGRTPAPTARNRTVPQAARYAGTYLALSSGRIVTLSARGDTLRATAGGESFVLVPRGPNVLVTEDDKTTFRVAAFSGPSDSLRSVDVSTADMSPTRFDRVIPGYVLDATTRSTLPGAWYSDELDVIWTLSAGPSGDVQLQFGGAPPRSLEAVTANVLRSGRLLLKLERDASGMVNAFTVVAGRASGMRFTRAGRASR